MDNTPRMGGTGESVRVEGNGSGSNGNYISSGVGGGTGDEMVIGSSGGNYENYVVKEITDKNGKVDARKLAKFLISIE